MEPLAPVFDTGAGPNIIYSLLVPQGVAILMD